MDMQRRAMMGALTLGVTTYAVVRKNKKKAMKSAKKIKNKVNDIF
ncbi:MAG: hypothetical protein ACK5LV_03680 [Lachnospirales bacterium]